MGRTHLFQCSRCQYRAAIAGGADRGLHCYVQTIRCRDCAALYDALVRLRVSQFEVDQPYRLWRRNLLTRTEPAVPRTWVLWHNRLALGGSPKLKWVQVKLSCPVSAHHRIEMWNQPGKCPRCGTFLERTLTPYRIWE